jgi:hypothetical protein
MAYGRSSLQHTNAHMRSHRCTWLQQQLVAQRQQAQMVIATQPNSRIGVAVWLQVAAWMMLAKH